MSVFTGFACVQWEEVETSSPTLFMSIVIDDYESEAPVHWISSPLWVLDLLCDKVQGVPSRVGEQSRVQSQSDVSWIVRGAVEHALEVLRVSWKHQYQERQLLYLHTAVTMT